MPLKTLLFVAIATLAGGPVYAYSFCSKPLMGGTLLERKATISSTRETHPCSNWVDTTSNKSKPGAKNWEKMTCGPIAIIKEISYSTCTTRDMISGSPSTQAICQFSGNTINYHFSVRDKSGVDHGAYPIESWDTKCEDANIFHTHEIEYMLHESDHNITVIENTSYPEKPKIKPDF